ncbi:DUF397 domain-containing protein [Streptomyces daliensis]|uniref:DUF397 domain-containing protein n=1 Tax=Streptomyces daliensis TaxID=299421 RepID=A0A8T4ISY0_9ACTN|nr:DUF397 domain-containing protein [Streptomyces daliensis]
MIRKHTAGVDTSLTWVKSSYSSDDGPSCVEVATDAEQIHIRDSKDVTRPHLTASPTAWSTFVALVHGSSAATRSR